MATFGSFAARATRATLTAGVLFALVFQTGAFGCANARFPVCENDEQCADKGDAKYCYNLRCVQCRYDDDCADGYCERKVAECKSLDGPRAGTATAEPTAQPAPEPSSSAPPP